VCYTGEDRSVCVADDTVRQLRPVALEKGLRIIIGFLPSTFDKQKPTAEPWVLLFCMGAGVYWINRYTQNP
jgi:hypothetical protein